MNKYHAKRTVVNERSFASKAEANRYGELLLLQRAGQISGLKLQPRYILQEAFVDSNGCKVGSIAYVADFEYVENKRIAVVVEDVKGMETQVFKIKSRMFRKRYPEYCLRIVKVR